MEKIVTEEIIVSKRKDKEDRQLKQVAKLGSTTKQTT
jgi:hypothetical protein